MTIKSNLLLVSILLSVATAQVDLSNKIRYYKDGLTDAFHLVNVIKPTPYTYTTYSDTSICKQDACNNPSALTAYQITYASNLGITVACFCDNPVFDITYMADNVGRVPYRVRQNVISYTAASIGKGGGAYTVSNQIVFQDQGENTEVFIHESGHVFDGTNGGLSSASSYQSAISNDACVPDDYAATNPVEDFAQLTVTWVYLALTNTATPACLSQSIAYMAQVLPKSTIQAQLQTYNQSTPTSAPPTSAPVTSAPVTSAPVTSAPVTSAPATSAPTPSTCTISVRQTLSNTWQSSGVTYTQYAVVFINNGASDVQSSNLAVQLLGALISQIWNLEQVKSGAWVLPSYQSSIAAGNQYSWGYVVQGSSPLSISFLLPSSCSSSATSAPATSAPATSAPVTSAPVTSAPVTSAPVTSAPVTSAPVTPAPTPSSTTAPGSSSCAFEIEQTLSNSWVNNGITYSQFNVVYRNAGTSPAAAVVQLGGGVITQIWNVQQGANGYYYLPSYQSTIAPNSKYSWGYIAQTSSALTIRLIC